LFSATEVGDPVDFDNIDLLAYLKVSISYLLDTDIENATIELFEAMGNTIRTIKINEKKGHEKVSIRELSNGIYYFRIVKGNQVSKLYKLIKNKTVAFKQVFYFPIPPLSGYSLLLAFYKKNM